MGNAGVTRPGRHTGPSLAAPSGGPTQALQGLPGAWLCRRGILLPACSWSPWHFGVHTSRLRLGGLRPPGCHSFLPANCLALSPAPPQPRPQCNALLHFASNGQLCVDKAQPPQRLPGCFWETHTGPAVGSGHSVARGAVDRGPEFFRHALFFRPSAQTSAQHSCSPAAGTRR